MVALVMVSYYNIRKVTKTEIEVSGQRALVIIPGYLATQTLGKKNDYSVGIHC